MQENFVTFSVVWCLEDAVQKINMLTTNMNSSEIVRSLPPLAIRIPKYKTYIVVKKPSENKKVRNSCKSSYMHGNKKHGRSGRNYNLSQIMRR